MRYLLWLVPFVALSLVALPAAHAQDAAEIEFWQSVKESGSSKELEAYLEAYPDGKFATLARIRLDALAGSDPPETGDAKSSSPSDQEASAAKETNTGADPREKVLRVTLTANPGVPDALNRVLLGVGVGPVSEGFASSFDVKPGKGVLIDTVLEETPAASAGLGPGMIILDLDGIPIDHPADLVREVGKRTPGETVSVRIIRVAKTKTEFARVLREGASDGNVHAMTQLGLSYASGSFSPKDDAEAVRWYRKAAEKGDVQAMSILGSRYVEGRGVPQDDAKAVHLLRQAAEKDDMVAMHAYGWMLEEGRGAKRDRAAAIGWYRKAAEKGYSGSMWNLGIAYEDGNGVAKDPAEAVRWYQKAAALGHKQAIKRLGTLGISETQPAADDDAPDLDDVSEDIGELD